MFAVCEEEESRVVPGPRLSVEQILFLPWDRYICVDLENVGLDDSEISIRNIKHEPRLMAGLLNSNKIHMQN